MGTAYPAGDHVSYGGSRDQCLLAHTAYPGWTPDVVPALRQKL
ncbi:carbohydrate-binding protein [Angustibacter luteus]|uniref:Carbohydrate-binding protein n=1 Tax=Angustibacter luteus TaxID=658456 RepID=A0ABW1JH40_9ACTN